MRFYPLPAQPDLSRSISQFADRGEAISRISVQCVRSSGAVLMAEIFVRRCWSESLSPQFLVCLRSWTATRWIKVL